MISSLLLPRLVVALAMSIGIALCASAQEPGRQRPTQHGLVERGNIWPTLNIPVCWEQDLTGFQNEVSWVLEAVQNTIEKYSRYTFSTKSGWPRCPQDDQPRIRILIEDALDARGKEIPPHSEVGFQHTTTFWGFETPRPTRTHLNFTFRNAFKDCASARKNCIQVISVHELLHALGFLHEQYNTNLKITDPACYSRIEPTISGDTTGIDPWPVTEYDPGSIMNYCRNIYSESPRLSQLDQKTLSVLATASESRMGSAR